MVVQIVMAFIEEFPQLPVSAVVLNSSIVDVPSILLENVHRFAPDCVFRKLGRLFVQHNGRSGCSPSINRHKEDILTKGKEQSLIKYACPSKQSANQEDFRS